MPVHLFLKPGEGGEAQAVIEEGVPFEGQRIPLISQQGIFKPRILPELPLSITTSHSGPYDDRQGAGDLLLYRYRGTDPMHRDNVGLRKAWKRQAPLVSATRSCSTPPTSSPTPIRSASRRSATACRCASSTTRPSTATSSASADYVVQVRPDVLEEEDGPMLLHGLKGMHGERILLPRRATHKPDPELLARRFEVFRGAA